ncbi:MAG: hypothetical protein ACREPT_01620 [Rudaea sp.]
MENIADFILKYGFASGVAIYGISYLATRLFRMRPEIATANLQAASTNTQIDMVELLTARVFSLEAAQARVWNEFDEERRKRSEAEGKVLNLTRRVGVLEAQIRELGHEPR